MNRLIVFSGCISFFRLFTQVLIFFEPFSRLILNVFFFMNSWRSFSNDTFFFEIYFSNFSKNQRNFISRSIFPSFSSNQSIFFLYFYFLVLFHCVVEIQRCESRTEEEKILSLWPRLFAELDSIFPCTRQTNERFLFLSFLQSPTRKYLVTSRETYLSLAITRVLRVLSAYENRRVNEAPSPHRPRAIYHNYKKEICI